MAGSSPSAPRWPGPPSLRCLVTGASGYIGGRLVPELLAAGHRAVFRPDAPAAGGGQLGRGDRPARLSVVLATSAKDDEVGLVLDSRGVGAAIGIVASSRAVERTKPGRGIVERALSESGTNRARAVMVGDTVWM